MPLSILPRQPSCCRCTPGVWSPFLAALVSSMSPMVPRPWASSGGTLSWGNQLEWDDKGTRKAQGVQRPENAGRCPVGEPAQVGGSARRGEGNATTRGVAVGGGGGLGKGVRGD